MPSPLCPPQAESTSAAGTTTMRSDDSSEPWGNVPTSVAYCCATEGSSAVTVTVCPSAVGYVAVVPAHACDAWATLPLRTRSLKDAAEAEAGRASTAATRHSAAELRTSMRSTLRRETENG